MEKITSAAPHVNLWLRRSTGCKATGQRKQVMFAAHQSVGIAKNIRPEVWADRGRMLPHDLAHIRGSRQCGDAGESLGFGKTVQ